jgi:hypothetical protein
LAEQVRLILEQSGVALGQLNDVILTSLQSKPPILPTSKALWEAIKNESSPSDFSQLLTLLTHCGVAESSQKKVYLYIDLK